SRHGLATTPALRTATSPAPGTSGPRASATESAANVDERHGLGCDPLDPRDRAVTRDVALVADVALDRLVHGSRLTRPVVEQAGAVGDAVALRVEQGEIAAQRVGRQRELVPW